MDNNDLGNDNVQRTEAYHATTNLNTAIENPQVNINNAVDVNIQDVVNNNNYNQIDNNFSSNNNDIDSNVTDFINDVSLNDNTNVEQVNNYVPTNNFDISNTNDEYQATGGNNVSYEPTLEEKKGNSKIAISKELRMMAFVVFILLIFIASIPAIYDFFKGLGLVISG